MAKRIYYVICDAGDGSNFIRWTTDTDVVDKMRELADSGDETYASGDGLQEYDLQFPDDFDLDAWIKKNHISITTLEDLKRYY